MSSGSSYIGYYESSYSQEKPVKRQAVKENWLKKLIKYICLYSLFNSKMIGKVLAMLISQVEKKEFEYYEFGKLTEPNENLISDDSKQVMYFIAEKKKIEEAPAVTKREIKEMSEKKEALVLHETKAKVNKIPLFKTNNIGKKLKEFKKFPYVQGFIDYTISKKAKESNFSNKTPEYTENELYNNLKEYLAKEKIKSKPEDKKTNSNTPEEDINTYFPTLKKIFKEDKNDKNNS